MRAYSLGMRQRLGLAGALLTRPDLLILDEPTNGLDPHGIREVRELLVELNEEGTTVFLSSHLLAEIEALCTRVGVVDHGRLVLEKPLDEVRHATGRIIVTTPDVERALGVLGRAVVDRTAEGGLVVVPADADGVHGLARHLVSHDVRLDALEPERVSLEDVVVDLTGPGNDSASGSSRTATNGRTAR